MLKISKFIKMDDELNQSELKKINGKDKIKR